VPSLFLHSWVLKDSLREQIWEILGLKDKWLIPTYCDTSPFVLFYWSLPFPVLQIDPSVNSSLMLNLEYSQQTPDSISMWKIQSSFGKARCRFFLNTVHLPTLWNIRSREEAWSPKDCAWNHLLVQSLYHVMYNFCHTDLMWQGLGSRANEKNCQWRARIV
jgi:hypothetical protein